MRAIRDPELNPGNRIKTARKLQEHPGLVNHWRYANQFWHYMAPPCKRVNVICRCHMVMGQMQHRPSVASDLEFDFISQRNVRVFVWGREPGNAFRRVGGPNHSCPETCKKAQMDGIDGMGHRERCDGKNRRSQLGNTIIYLRGGLRHSCANRHQYIGEQ